MSIFGSFLEGVLAEEDHYRLKMGRFRDGDEREMRRLIERDWSASYFKRLLGGGTDIGRVGYFSSRPRMEGGGTTFAFNQRWVAKRHEVPVAKDRVHFHHGDAEAAAAVGARWDRGVRVDGKSGSWWVKSGGALPSGAFPARRVEPRATGYCLGTAGSHQSYIEREGAAALSIGNLGETPEERKAFWGTVEEFERAGGRVQGRIIAELPWEPRVGDDGRRQIVEEFCSELDRLGVPWWAVIHRPEKQNDSRNWHAHILFHDRKIERWVARENDGVMERRPVFSSRKVPEIQARGFIEKIRSRWAACVNGAFEHAGLARRFDPRSYEAAGVEKRPGVHLGSAAMALERKGIATSRGGLAVGVEMEGRISATATRLAKLAEGDRARLEKGIWLLRGGLAGGAAAAAAAHLAETGRRLAEAGRLWRRAAASHDIAQWTAADRPRRITAVGRSGPAALRGAAVEIGRRFREMGRAEVRGSRRRLAEAVSRHSEAEAAFAGAERRMMAELLVQDLRRARERLVLLEASFGGRVAMTDWKEEDLAAQERKRAMAEGLAIAREATRRTLEAAFGEKAAALVDVALDPRRRRQVVQAMDDDGIGKAGGVLAAARQSLDNLTSAEVAHSAALADVDRRARISGSPGALARVALTAVEEEAWRSAKKGLAAADAAVSASRVAAEIAGRRGLIKDRDGRGRGARDHPI